MAMCNCAIVSSSAFASDLLKAKTDIETNKTDIKAAKDDLTDNVKTKMKELEDRIIALEAKVKAKA